jgi:hypothetical protein
MIILPLEVGKQKMVMLKEAPLEERVMKKIKAIKIVKEVLNIRKIKIFT